jgi:hypothetical protein
MDGAKAGAHGDLSDDSPARVSINSPAFAQDAKGRATRRALRWPLRCAYGLPGPGLLRDKVWGIRVRAVRKLAA